MEAKKIEQYLVRKNINSSNVMAHFTAPNWFECDVARVTSAGFWTEFEVKVSRSDFRADFKKEGGYYPGDGQGYNRHNKHEAMKCGSCVAPNYFYFVCPEGLLSVEDMPDYAGLIFVTGSNSWHPLEVVKKAPRIHKNKVDGSFVNEMMRIGANRYLWKHIIPNEPNLK